MALTDKEAQESIGHMEPGWDDGWANRAGMSIAKMVDEYTGRCWNKDGLEDFARVVTRRLKRFIPKFDIAATERLTVSPADADLLRQWFNAVEDLNPGYLTHADRTLYATIKIFLAKTYDMEHPKTCTCEICRAWGA